MVVFFSLSWSNLRFIARERFATIPFPKGRGKPSRHPHSEGCTLWSPSVHSKSRSWLAPFTKTWKCSNAPTDCRFLGFLNQMILFSASSFSRASGSTNLFCTNSWSIAFEAAVGDPSSGWTSLSMVTFVSTISLGDWQSLYVNGPPLELPRLFRLYFSNFFLRWNVYLEQTYIGFLIQTTRCSISGAVP